MNIIKRIKSKYINKRLLRLIFSDMYSIYTDALDKGSSLSIIELERAIGYKKNQSDTPFAKVYNKELDLLKDKLNKNKTGNNILCSDLVREIYKTYSIFLEALKWKP